MMVPVIIDLEPFWLALCRLRGRPAERQLMGLTSQVRGSLGPPEPRVLVRSGDRRVWISSGQRGAHPATIAAS